MLLEMVNRILLRCFFVMEVEVFGMYDGILKSGGYLLITQSGIDMNR